MFRVVAEGRHEWSVDSVRFLQGKREFRIKGGKCVAHHDDEARLADELNVLLWWSAPLLRFMSYNGFRLVAERTAKKISNYEVQS